MKTYVLTIDQLKKLLLDYHFGDNYGILNAHDFIEEWLKNNT